MACLFLLLLCGGNAGVGIRPFHDNYMLETSDKLQTTTSTMLTPRLTHFALVVIVEATFMCVAFLVAQIALFFVVIFVLFLDV